MHVIVDMEMEETKNKKIKKLECVLTVGFTQKAAFLISIFLRRISFILFN